MAWNIWCVCRMNGTAARSRGCAGSGANYGRERNAAYSPLLHRAERTAFQTAGAAVSLRGNFVRFN